MTPIRTARTQMLYRGPTPDIGDAWVRQEGLNEAYMTWALTDEERAAIAAGANLELGIFQTPIPPVELAVTSDQAITDAGAALTDRARAILRGLAAGPLSVPAGFWLVSEDVWQALNREHALNTTSVPLLVGRPLMVGAADLPADTLTYEKGGGAS